MTQKIEERVELLILGDSLVADHDWQARMPMFSINNLGVPGAVAADLLESLDNVKLTQDHADVIMVMIGTNDLLEDNLFFTETVKEISVRLHGNYPKAELLISSILPMELPHFPYDTIPKINAEIESCTMQTGGCFFDTHKRLALSSKQIFQNDGVHITPAAYEIWSRSLIEYIAFLIEDD